MGNRAALEITANFTLQNEVALYYLMALTNRVLFAGTHLRKYRCDTLQSWNQAAVASYMYRIGLRS